MEKYLSVDANLDGNGGLDLGFLHPIRLFENNFGGCGPVLCIWGNCKIAYSCTWQQHGLAYFRTCNGMSLCLHLIAGVEMCAPSSHSLLGGLWRHTFCMRRSFARHDDPHL